MELFLNNYLLLYFFTLVMFLKPETMQTNQKIFIAYLFAYLVDLTNKISTSYVVIITLLCLFLLLEYFVKSEFKLIVMTKAKYKLLDFSYLMFAQYALVRFLIVIFFNSSFFSSLLQSFSIELPAFIILIMQVLLMFSVSNTVFSLRWEIEELDKVKQKLEENMKIYDMPDEFNYVKFDIVARLEDKSYYCRKKCGSVFTIEYLTKYLYPRIKNMICSISARVIKWPNNDLSIGNRICFFIRNIIEYLNKVYYVFKRIILSLKRGHSTIEVQLIRSIGIKNGYTRKRINIIKRKIFEIIYSKIVFISLQEFYERYLYANSNRMKDFLMYNYLRYAKSVLLEETNIGLEKVFNKDISYLNEDELFIGTLSFSNYSLNKDKILKNAEIYNYSISEENIDSILNVLKELNM